MRRESFITNADAIGNEQALRKALEVKPEQRMRDVDEWISVFV